MQIRGGMEGLLEFLQMLEKRGIHFSLHYWQPDSIDVYFTLVTRRVEVSFYNDHFEFSYFAGDEDVSRESGKLIELIDQNWG